MMGDDDVGGFDIAVEEAGAMEAGELVSNLSERVETLQGVGGVVFENGKEAVAVDETSDHVRSLASRKSSESEDFWDAQSFETGEGDCFADEGLDLVLIGAFGESFESDGFGGELIADGPDLSAAAFAQDGQFFVARWKD